MTPNELTRRKGHEKIAVLTAYTADVARCIDPYVDVILVGDSLGMVLYGFNSTTEVSLPLMIAHGKAVCKVAKRALVVVDMPFGSVEHGKEEALAHCRLVLEQTGAGAVKIEGGAAMEETIAHLTQHGIAVMSHIGMMPQKAAEYGGFKVQGKTEEQRAAIVADALAVARAGAFAVVIEAVSEPLARELTALLSIPTIGIGASPACDGQVLVSEDMAGLTQSKFKFVRRFANLGEQLAAAAQDYAAAVKAGSFPSPAECYG